MPNKFSRTLWKKPPDTSWEKVGEWYHALVGESGQYFHEQVIFPKSLELLQFLPEKACSLLDLCCGQGVLARILPPHVVYVGVDLSPSLIQAAKKITKHPHASFLVGDVTRPLPVKKKDFTHAVCILALQNVQDPLALFQQAYQHLQVGGRLLLVCNHPCFRIPRQSSWGIDPHTQMQYRRMDRYLTPMQIPIQANPGKGAASSESLSFHYPLSFFTESLDQAGFSIERLQEWISPKESTGKMAKRENRSREEFPLFLAILARKREGGLV